MKTIRQTLDNYARNPRKAMFKYKNWDELMEYNNTESITIHIHNVMQEYATEAIKADRERVAEHAYMKYHCGHFKTDTPTQYHQNGADNIQIDKQSILNLPIELP